MDLTEQCWAPRRVLALEEWWRGRAPTASQLGVGAFAHGPLCPREGDCCWYPIKSDVACFYNDHGLPGLKKK